MPPMPAKAGCRIGDRAQLSESCAAAQPVVAVPGVGQRGHPHGRRSPRLAERP
jgi:hypothetical protein